MFKMLHSFTEYLFIYFLNKNNLIFFYRLGYLFSTEWPDINTPNNLLNKNQRKSMFVFFL